MDESFIWEDLNVPSRDTLHAPIDQLSFDNFYRYVTTSDCLPDILVTPFR